MPVTSSNFLSIDANCFSMCCPLNPASTNKLVSPASLKNAFPVLPEASTLNCKLILCTPINYTYFLIYFFIVDRTSVFDSIRHPSFTELFMFTCDHDFFNCLNKTTLFVTDFCFPSRSEYLYTTSFWHFCRDPHFDRGDFIVTGQSIP